MTEYLESQLLNAKRQLYSLLLKCSDEYLEDNELDMMVCQVYSL